MYMQDKVLYSNGKATYKNANSTGSGLFMFSLNHDNEYADGVWMVGNVFLA